MKRYWLFECEQYYSNGGIMDWKGDYNTLEEARNARSIKYDPNISYKEAIDKRERDLGYHILDIQERMIVEGYDQYNKEVIRKTEVENFN